MNPLSTDITQDPRWASIVTRDRTADGTFWYSVATTGVFCRPSCPSRRANPKNVRLHESVAAAEAAGFRACRRCNPGGISIEAANNAIVAKACKLIDEAGETLSLAQVAESVELSPHYFHRLFKKATGLTPKAYAVAGRSARLRDGLARAATVTEAFLEAGYGSNGRFYEASTGVLGMSPTHYRSGGAQEVLTFAVGQCSLGAILVASSAKGVAAILLGDDPETLVRDLEDRFPRARLVGGDAAYEQLVAQVVAWSKRLPMGSPCPSTCAARPSSSASGWPFARSRPARRRRTRALPRRSVRRDPFAPWPELARPTPTRSRYRATASSATTAASRAIAGEWSASAS